MDSEVALRMNAGSASLVEVGCPVCGSSEGKELFETQDYTLRCTEDRFVLRKCKVCGVGYLSPRPRAEDMKRYYPSSYYWSWEQADKELDWEEIIRRRFPQLKAKALWLKDMQPGRLLDVGAQKGEFIWFMQQRGWEVEGVEIDNSIPNPASMPIRYGDFLQIPIQKGYDCITFWAVLEHVYEPAPYVEKAASLLRPGGRMVILVTNLNSIQSRWLRLDDYPRHLTIFTRRSLKFLLERYGLRCIRFHTGQDIFGGSLNGALLLMAKILGGYSFEEALSEWKQVKDPNLFWIKWRGRYSPWVRWVSRIDKVITWPVEKALDQLGFGFNLLVVAEKKA